MQNVIHLETFTICRSKEYYELAHSSDDIEKYLPGFVKNSLESSAKAVDTFSMYNYWNDFAFLITNNIHTPVGAIFAYQNLVSNALDVNYFIGDKYRRQGFMKSAIMAFKDYIKSNTPYSYLMFDVRIDNIPSQKLLTSLGARNLGFSDFYPFEHYYQYEMKV